MAIKMSENNDHKIETKLNHIKNTNNNNLSTLSSSSSSLLQELLTICFEKQILSIAVAM